MGPCLVNDPGCKWVYQTPNYLFHHISKTALIRIGNDANNYYEYNFYDQADNIPSMSYGSITIPLNDYVRKVGNINHNNINWVAIRARYSEAGSGGQYIVNYGFNMDYIHFYHQGWSMKGQIAYEFVGTVAVIMLLLVVFTGIVLGLRGEAADIEASEGDRLACQRISQVLGNVYLAGDGSEAEITINRDFMVRPGLVGLPTTGDNIHFCSVDVGLFNESGGFGPGVYRVRNVGGVLEFG
jgi:hypothetical protein